MAGHFLPLSLRATWSQLCSHLCSLGRCILSPFCREHTWPTQIHCSSYCLGLMCLLSQMDCGQIQPSRNVHFNPISQSSIKHPICKITALKIYCLSGTISNEYNLSWSYHHLYFIYYLIRLYACLMLLYTNYQAVSTPSPDEVWWGQGGLHKRPTSADTTLGGKHTNTMTSHCTWTFWW
jgi:hypothetical protein